ncbi:hypothetical protein AgCh_005154 [Apium graveolens]
MDPDSVKSTLQNLAFGNVLAAAARDYKKEVLAQEKAHASSTSNQEEVDLDELMDDPELEKLHADRIAALKKEAEKRQSLKKQGHGEYRDITEADFLGEVTGCDKLICHFYHREFYRCKIMDKHLKTLAARHLETKCIRLDAENAPFFVGKLGIKTLPCVILFRSDIFFIFSHNYISLLFSFLKNFSESFKFVLDKFGSNPEFQKVCFDWKQLPRSELDWICCFKPFPAL